MVRLLIYSEKEYILTLKEKNIYENSQVNVSKEANALKLKSNTSNTNKPVFQTCNANACLLPIKGFQKGIHSCFLPIAQSLSRIIHTADLNDILVV